MALTPALALGRLMQEEPEFDISLCCIGRHCLKETNKNKTNQNKNP
jgi:hypothetical protein